MVFWKIYILDIYNVYNASKQWILCLQNIKTYLTLCQEFFTIFFSKKWFNSKDNDSKTISWTHEIPIIISKDHVLISFSPERDFSFNFRTHYIILHSKQDLKIRNLTFSTLSILNDIVSPFWFWTPITELSLVNPSQHALY